MLGRHCTNSTTAQLHAACILLVHSLQGTLTKMHGGTDRFCIIKHLSEGLSISCRWVIIQIPAAVASYIQSKSQSYHSNLFMLLPQLNCQILLHYTPERHLHRNSMSIFVDNVNAIFPNIHKDQIHFHSSYCTPNNHSPDPPSTEKPQCCRQRPSSVSGQGKRKSQRELQPLKWSSLVTLNLDESHF